MEQTVTTGGASDTELLAEKIGKRLKGGEVIELVSDLGGGKTTFVRGLARGAGSSTPVASPTFTVSKVYEAPNFEIHHFDFYRLQNAGLIEHELEDLLFSEDIVLVLEWSGIVQNVLPVERIVIEIKPTSDHERSFTISCPEKLAYAVGGIC